MNYEFQSSLYRTPSELAAAIAGEWLCAGGANTREFMIDTLKSYSDADMADECIEGWGFTTEWMESRGIDRDKIINAFADLRISFYERFPKSD